MTPSITHSPSLTSTRRTRRDGGGVGFLERPHVLPAPEALPGLGHLHHVVLWVAHVVFLFGDVAGIKVGKEAVRLLLVHEVRSFRWPLFVSRIANATVSRIAHIAYFFLGVFSEAGYMVS